MASNVIVGYAVDWQDPISGAYEITPDLESLEIADGDSAETMYSVNQSAIGPKTSRGNSTISLTQRATVENAARPDWQSLKRQRLACLLTTTEIGTDGQTGQRVAYNVQVASVSRSVNNTGDVTRSVELTIVSDNVQ